MSAAAIDRERLESALGRCEWIAAVELRESVGSTNDELRALAAAGAPDATVLIADCQTAGRGRRGRSWYSPGGLGLYVSVLLRDPGPAATATRWTLAAAVAAAEACRALGAADVCIEWPNDLIARGAKLGGVLAEGRTTAAGVEQLVVGTGINVQHAPEDFPAALAGQATSLRIVTGGLPVAREALAGSYLERLGVLRQILAGDRWPELAARWEALAPDAHDRLVEVRRSDGTPGALRGVTAGIDARGALRVRGLDGRMFSVHFADALCGLEG